MNRLFFIGLGIGVIFSSCSLLAYDPLYTKNRASVFSYLLYAYHAGLSYYCWYHLIQLSTICIRSQIYKHSSGDFLAETSFDSFTTGHLTHASQKMLRSFSTREFSAMIEALLQGHSEEKQKEIRAAIMTQFNLYQFPAFIDALKQLPEFSNHMQELAELLKTPTFAQQVASIQGFEKGAFGNFIAHLTHMAKETNTKTYTASDDIVSQLLFQ